MSDEARPALVHHTTEATTATLPNDTEDQPRLSKAPDYEEPLDPVPTSSMPSFHDFLLLFCILILLVWPWVFFGTVWAKKGIKMNNHVALVVQDNPHATTYFVTLICTIIAMIVTALFSLAVVRFAQELVTRYKPTRPFHLRVLLAIRHQSWPFGKSWKDAKYLMDKDRWWPATLLIISVLTFPHLVSTTTSLITPIPFIRTANLTGLEIDFSSTDPTCLSFYQGLPLPTRADCGWVAYQGSYYTNCRGANQMVDVLEAGRGNILELISNNSQSLTFSQLGASDGLHFLGSIRGILPIGPDGVPAFDTLDPSPLSDPEIMAGTISYNYTLNQQGLLSNLSCSYQPTSPIIYSPTSSLTLEYNASCAAVGQVEVPTNYTAIGSIIGNAGTLTSWVCQSAPSNTQATSYFIYVRGIGPYEANIGNITCTLFPMRPAVFPVTFRYNTGTFSAGTIAPAANESLASPQSVFSSLINETLIGLAEVILEAQNFDSNLVAESVTTFGVKSFGQDPAANSTTYLHLYERMIQGILEYQTTYIRLIYSSVSDTPLACIRTVDGFVDYQVFGWHVTSANIGFLIPLTIINGAALAALILAMTIGKVDGYLHPRHPREVTYDPDANEEVPDEWKEKVTFQPTSILKERMTKVTATLMQGGKNAAKAGAEDVVEMATK